MGNGWDQPAASSGFDVGTEHAHHPPPAPQPQASPRWSRGSGWLSAPVSKGPGNPEREGGEYNTHGMCWDQL